MIKIIADSGCDFSTEMVNNNVRRIPLTLQLGNNIYEDNETLDIPAYISKLKNTPKGRKTAAPSPEKYYEAYKEGDAVFVVTLSRHLSGSYASAQTARNMYLEDIGEKFIHIIDSQSASAGETLIVHKLTELTEKGLTPEEIRPLIDAFVTSMNTYFILESFDTIVDSGRMNGYVARLASMLNIVPICAGVEGKMALLTQARGRKKAYAKLAELMAAENNTAAGRELYITHVDNSDEAEKLAEYLNSKLAFKDVKIIQPTGLVCTYADYHGLVIAF